jgi:hypothetical protein
VTVLDRTGELLGDIARSGYYPEIVREGILDAVSGEPVLAFVAHHEPTFDREELRRHMTVMTLTPTRVILTHTDEFPGDDLLPKPYTSTASEAVPIGRIGSVVVTRMVSAHGKRLEEVVLNVSWGGVSRIELEPAQCDNPECERDHGYSGSLTGDDLSLRMSAAADGPDAVRQLLEFARALSSATTRPL